jgi:hypothetical protein
VSEAKEGWLRAPDHEPPDAQLLLVWRGAGHYDLDIFYSTEKGSGFRKCTMPCYWHKLPTPPNDGKDYPLGDLINLEDVRQQEIDRLRKENADMLAELRRYCSPNRTQSQA